MQQEQRWSIGVHGGGAEAGAGRAIGPAVGSGQLRLGAARPARLSVTGARGRGRRVTRAQLLGGLTVALVMMRIRVTEGGDVADMPEHE